MMWNVRILPAILLLSTALSLSSAEVGWSSAYNDETRQAFTFESKGGFSGAPLRTTLQAWDAESRVLTWNTSSYIVKYIIGVRNSKLLVAVDSKKGTIPPQPNLVSTGPRLLAFDVASGALKDDAEVAESGRIFIHRPLILSSGRVFAVIVNDTTEASGARAAAISIPSGRDFPLRRFSGDVDRTPWVERSVASPTEDVVYFPYTRLKLDSRFTRFNASGLEDPVSESVGRPLSGPSLFTNPDDGNFVYVYGKGGASDDPNTQVSSGIVPTVIKVDKTLKNIVWKYASLVIVNGTAANAVFLKPVFAESYIVMPLRLNVPPGILSATVQKQNGDKVDVGLVAGDSILLLFLDPESGDLLRAVSKIPSTISPYDGYGLTQDPVYYSHDATKLVLTGEFPIGSTNFISDIDIYEDLGALGVPLCSV